MERVLPGALTDDRVAALREALAAHDPIDEREAASVARVLAELDRLERPFDRHADLVHVTGSAVVVGTPGTVLHLHKRLHRWLQPGGHVDAGESPADTARRETLEETGLPASHPDGRPELLHVDVHEAADDHVHLDLRYLLVATSDELAPAEGESPDVRWFAWDDALAVADDALIGALRRAEAWRSAHE